MGSSVQLSKDTIGVGEPLTASVTVFKPSNQRILGIDLEPLHSPTTLINMVAAADSLGNYPQPDMEISNLGEWQAYANEKQLNNQKLHWINDAASNKDFITSEVEYIFWDPGIYQMSGVNIMVQDSNLLNSIVPMEGSILYVMPPESLMDTTVKKQELRPIKSIIIEDKNWRDYMWLYGLIALVLLSLLAFFLFSRYYNPHGTDKNKNKENIIPISPYDNAIQNLKQLKEQELWQQGKIKEYQSKLTLIIRKYISDGYKIPAMENTSEEIIRSLRNKNFDPSLNTQLKEILTIADLVKFAKANPPADIHDRFMDQALDLVNATKIETIKVEKPPVFTALQFHNPINENHSFCVINDYQKKTSSTKLYKWKVRLFSSLLRKKIVLSETGKKMHLDRQSYYWKIYNPIASTLLFIPLIGGYVSLILFILTFYLIPVIIIADLVKGKRPFSRGLLVLKNDGKIYFNKDEKNYLQELKKKNFLIQPNPDEEE